jgi:hypothetical protein
MKEPYTSVYGIDFIKGVIREREMSLQGKSLVKISEDGSRVRREKELVRDSTAWERTIYAVRPEDI